MAANNITLIIQNRTVPKISLNPQPSNEWGKIGGLLSNQLDLWNALLGKADASHTHTFAQITSKPTTLAGYGITDAASLDVSGKVPASQLPSYVDDVLEFANAAAFPVTGESGKIYIALDTNFQYRWTGSTYIQITSSSAVWGSISGLLGNQSDLVAALASKYDASNPSGFITSSALVPYLMSATAASTYQPIGTYATPNNAMTFTNKSGNISQWINDSGYITSSALSPYLTITSAASTYQPIGSYLTGLTVGTTTIGSGTNTRILYNNAGVLGEYLVTGTGTTAVLSTSPTFTTSILTPTVTGINGALTFTNAVRTSGNVTSFTFTNPNNTNQTAGANIPGFLFTTGSRQYANGAITLQEEVRITAPTYSHVSGSNIITTAATLSVYGPTTSGGFTTITNPLAALFNGRTRVDSGTSSVLIGSQVGNTARGAIYINQSTPNTLNYALSAHETSGQTYINGVAGVSFLFNGGIQWSNTDRLSTFGAGLTHYDLAFTSTNGTKFGTATSQRIGFWNATPVVRPSGWATPTGTLTRTTFNSDTATLGQVAERLAALITDINTIGLIGA